MCDCLEKFFRKVRPALHLKGIAAGGDARPTIFFCRWAKGPGATAYYLLLTAYRSPLTAYRSPPSSGFSLAVVSLYHSEWCFLAHLWLTLPSTRARQVPGLAAVPR